jgi:cell division protein FtsL
MNMNVASKVLTDFNQQRALTQGYAVTQQETLILVAPKLSWVVLVLAVLFLLLGMVYLKDYNRQLFVNDQKLQQEYVALQVSSGKLALTQNLAASHTYVQGVAESNLNMRLPEAKDVVLLN